MCHIKIVQDNVIISLSPRPEGLEARETSNCHNDKYANFRDQIGSSHESHRREEFIC